MNTCGLGYIAVYSHNGRIGAMVQFYCNDSFTTRTDEFKELANSIAMQVAGADPKVISVDDIDTEIRNKEMEKAKKLNEKKSEKEFKEAMKFWSNKIDQENCLLAQSYIKDPAKTVGELIKEFEEKYGVKVSIDRFIRYEVN